VAIVPELAELKRLSRGWSERERVELSVAMFGYPDFRVKTRVRFPAFLARKAS
jgi:hypothetical protein